MTTADRPGISREQLAAIELSSKTAIRLASDHPEIADAYRSGMTRPEIVDGFSITGEYGVTETIALNSVYLALRDLIPSEEREALAREHYLANSRVNARIGGLRGGPRSQQLGVGIHSQTPEERREIASIGGQVSGNMTLELGIGIHSQTAEERDDARRKGIIARGEMPWSEEEKEYLSSLCQDPAYQYSSGANRGRPVYVTVLADLNSRFGNSRSRSSLINMWNKIRHSDKRPDSS